MREFLIFNQGSAFSEISKQKTLKMGKIVQL